MQKKSKMCNIICVFLFELHVHLSRLKKWEYMSEIIKNIILLLKRLTHFKQAACYFPSPSSWYLQCPPLCDASWLQC